MNASDRNAVIRLRAFQFLDSLKKSVGDALPRDVLERGFDFDGIRVPMLGPQGIFKPAILTDAPLSITTVPITEGKRRPYEDSEGEDGLIRYKYRGTDPTHRENVGLRQAMQHKIPIVYFFGLIPGRYAAEYPCYIVGDDPEHLSFSVAVDDVVELPAKLPAVAEDMAMGRRVYVTSTTQRRLHQQGFRERVLSAYRQCCAVCRLAHSGLLDAAHILPDGHPRGEPWVSNGLSLCKIHHAAYDQNILGIDGALKIKIRADILIEKDGPMLRHGLQELEGKTLLVVPTAGALRPREEFLEERYREFLQAG
jgi:putative restriction endonuclease